METLLAFLYIPCQQVHKLLLREAKQDCEWVFFNSICKKTIHALEKKNQQQKERLKSGQDGNSRAILGVVCSISMASTRNWVRNLIVKLGPWGFLDLIGPEVGLPPKTIEIGPN